MFSYTNILRKAYSITAHFPVLWVFGLFVIGGFNLNFFQFQDLPARHFLEHIPVRELLMFFENHPQKLAGICFSILVFSGASLIATNWSRVMLVLLTRSVLDRNLPNLIEQVPPSRFFIQPVVAVSLFTTSLIVIVASVLFIPPYFIQNPELQTILWSGGVVLFLPIAFAISCINIFTTFFIVLFKQPFAKALNQGTDFFVSRWTQILGIVLLLLILYIFCFFVGISVILIVQNFFRLVLESFQGFHILGESAIIWLPRLLSALAVWMLLAILNVFINTALLLLFLELVKPIEAENAKLPAVQPVPMILS